MLSHWVEWNKNNEYTFFANKNWVFKNEQYVLAEGYIGMEFNRDNIVN